MLNNYEHRLSKATGKLQEAKKQAEDALAEIDGAADELLHEGEPSFIRGQHADPVDATDHVKTIISRFEAVNIEARAAIVELNKVRKMSGKASYGMGKLYADLITEGEDERARRKNKQTSLGPDFTKRVLPPDADDPGPCPDAFLERARELGQAHRELSKEFHLGTASAVAEKIGEPMLCMSWRELCLATYQKELTGPGAAVAEALRGLGEDLDKKRGPGRPKKK